ncbi:MAG: 50S ribosomal protein L35 [bacterium]
MPKMKTNRSAAKRFKITKTGKVVRSKAYKRHLLTSKNRKTKRQLREDVVLDKGDAKRIRRLLCV